MPALGNEIQINHVILIDKITEVELVKSVIDLINDSIIHSNYLGVTD